MKSEQLVSVLSAVIYDLLYDISMGHGEEALEAPVVAPNAKGLEADLAIELAKLWDGNKSLSRYNLLANVLKICSSDIDIFSDIAAITAAAYPIKDEGVKLSSNGIMGLIKNCCTATPTEAPVAEVVEDKSPFAPIDEPVEDVKPDKPKAEHNYMMKNSDEHSANSKQHQEMLEAKRALAAERAALK